MFHHTQSMLQFKFATSFAPDRHLVDLLWCPSTSQSLASRISSLSIRRWRSTAAITVTCSCHSSCCPWYATCQAISSSFNKTAHLHTGHATTVCFLERSTPALIPPDLWPPNSTDINLVDYKIWGDIQQQSQLHSIDELKKRLLDAWHVMDRSVTDDAIIDEWRKSQTPLIRFVVDLLWTCCTACCTTNPQQIE